MSNSTYSFVWINKKNSHILVSFWKLINNKILSTWLPLIFCLLLGYVNNQSNISKLHLALLYITKFMSNIIKHSVTVWYLSEELVWQFFNFFVVLMALSKRVRDMVALTNVQTDSMFKVQNKFNFEKCLMFKILYIPYSIIIWFYFLIRWLIRDGQVSGTLWADAFPSVGWVHVFDNAQCGSV